MWLYNKGENRDDIYLNSKDNPNRDIWDFLEEEPEV